MKIAEIMSTDLGGADRERLKKSLGSELTVVATADEPAEAVAARVDEERGGLVVVVDEAREPTGVVMPEEVRRAVARVRGQIERSLPEVIEDVERDAPDALVDLGESLRSIRPRMHWCNAGQHYTSRAPCPVHE